MPKKTKSTKIASYRKFFQDLPEPVWIVDPATLQILEANRKAEAFTGVARSELTGRTLLDLVQPWNAEQFRLALQTRGFTSPELSGITAVTKAGAPVEVDLLINPTEWNGVDAWIVVFSDAAPRVRLEEQLRQAQKMESVGMLAGGIAHDFNNLLTIISGYSHMLVSSLANDARNRSAAEQVIKASDRAAALTGQLLAFSRRQVLQPKVLELGALVNGMTPMLRRLIGENIDLRIEPARDANRIHADPGQIEQVVMNLVVNARDAMPSGGTLLIEVANVNLTEPSVGRHLELRSGQYVVLSVTDTGVGMDDATRAKIFEPFFTTKGSGRGTGLGLSMVMEIVKRGGGGVDIYSEPGHGTTVKVYVPKADRGETEPVALNAKPPTRGWETVLLVEDEEAVRSLVRTTLEMQGYQVLVAADGTEALRVSEEHTGTVHLLITDIVMPGLNGREVARKLHRTRRAMHVLYMSGYTEVALKLTNRKDRSTNFLCKPFTPSVLASKVRDVLERTGASAARQKRAGL